MRTINLYSFSELSKAAQQKAIEEIRYTLDYPYNQENENTLKEFEELFNINVCNWGYDNYSYSYNFEINNYEIEELEGLRLYKYIQNNIADNLFKGKFYHIGKWNDGKYTYKHRHSKVLLNNDCVLTGYYIDQDILNPVYEYLKKPNLNLTYHDLIKECLESFFYACMKDVEATETDEYIAEFLEANDHYEFHEDGTKH